MLLAALFLAALVRSLASPAPVNIPASPIPSPIPAVIATPTGPRCDNMDARSTFDILYSCTGVILLCTYISIHHNIPDQNDSWVKATWMKWRTTFLALLAPEMVILWALRQRIMAGRIAEKNKHRGWTKTHGFFAQMGGLMMECDTRKWKHLTKERQDDLKGYESQGQGVTYKVVREVWWMRDRWWSSLQIPHIPEREIQDHGKGDLLSKGIVLVQTSWFVIQCSARHIQGIALTEIELVTLAFAALNVITYMLWWDKPLNVGYPIYIDYEGKRVDGPQERKNRAAWSEEWYGGLWLEINWLWRWNRSTTSSWLGRVREDIRHDGTLKTIIGIILEPFAVIFRPFFEMANWNSANSRRSTSVPPFYAAYLKAEDRMVAYMHSSTIGMAFGAIHLIGWEFRFPTAAELWLWRTCSLILTIAPLLVALSTALGIAYKRNPASTLGNAYDIGFSVFGLLGFFASPLYILARLIILFQAFFALRDLPPSAYQNVDWTDFIPHI